MNKQPLPTKETTRLNTIAEALQELKEDFIDYVTSGIPNPAMYCANKCPECVNGRGWCSEDHSKCRGFSPRCKVTDIAPVYDKALSKEELLHTKLGSPLLIVQVNDPDKQVCRVLKSIATDSRFVTFSDGCYELLTSYGDLWVAYAYTPPVI